MISEAALSDKNEENAKLPLPNIFEYAEVLLYPCLQYCIVKEGISVVKSAAY